MIIFFDQDVINHSVTALVSKHPSMSRQVPELKSWLPTHWYLMWAKSSSSVLLMD